MSASLADITQVANDGDIQERVAGYVATLGLGFDPVAWAINHKWQIAVFSPTPEVENTRICDSYQYAEATKTINQNPRTGQRTDSILDSVIEAAVDSIIAAEAIIPDGSA